MKIFSYRYAPLSFYVFYSLFVFFCLFVGPIKYKGIDYVVLIGYVFGMLILFTVGFIFGAKGIFREQGNIYLSRRYCYNRVKSFVSALLFFGAISAITKAYIFLFVGRGLDFGNIGANYVAGYENYVRGQARVDILYILNILEQVISVLSILMCFYYYSVLGKLSRYVFICTVLIYLVANVVESGKQKYLGDIIVFLFFCTMVNCAAKDKKIKPSFLILCSLSAGFVSWLFIEILRQRYEAVGINLGNIGSRVHILMSWDESSEIINWVSKDYGLALGILLGYFTNGLYGLYLSLTLPFEWSYFVGNSYSLGRIAEILTSEDGAVLKHTYPYRVSVEYGWGFDKWHSLFSWMASDISFTGVLILTPVFAYIYAKLWLQAVRASNPFAGALFFYLSMGLIFSYSNNQIMHGLAGVIVLFILLAGWLIFRCRISSYSSPTSESSKGESS